MFRRKEDSLFDNASDPSQTQNATPETASAPQAQAPAAQANAGYYGSAPTGQAPAGQAARSNADPRANATAPAPQQPSSNFRPNTTAPISGDMMRNRMPEAKSAIATAATTMAQQTQTAPQAPQAPSSERVASKGRRVLTVGNDILLKGEIATCDRLVIEGKVDAALNDVHTVEIAENGSFKGSAQIEDAEISGLFEGDLIVRNRLVIYATGKVRGKISYGEIEIERGGELTGEIKLTTAQPGIGSRPARTTQTAPAPKEDKVAA